MATVNPFEQAARHAAQLDPTGFLRWLLGPAAERYRFRDWLDIPVLSVTDHSADLVAELVEKSVVALGWAVPILFRAEPDQELFGRLLELWGRLWRESHPNEQPIQRFQIAAAVLNLTSSPRTSRVIHFGEGLRLSLDVREINLAEKEAMPLLDAIAEGKHTRALLPFIPLMRGGKEESVRDRWQAIAQQEPDIQRRADAAYLAVVLADLVDAGTVWEKILEAEEMKPSAQILALKPKPDSKRRKKPKKAE
jgi:hypothetical protein